MSACIRMIASAVTGLKMLWLIPGARFAAGICVIQVAISLIASDRILLEGISKFVRSLLRKVELCTKSFAEGDNRLLCCCRWNNSGTC